MLRTVARKRTKSTRAHTAVIRPVCTVTVTRIYLSGVARAWDILYKLTANDPVDDVVCGSEARLVLAL